MAYPTELSFWMKVDIKGNDECWNWLACVDAATGYGHFKAKTFKGKSAHRFSWELHNGEPAGDFFVCHRCNNRKCVNPNHLYRGTQFDNMQDRLRNGNHNFARRTHCKYGHPFDATNSYQWRNMRVCRECRRLRQIANKARK